MTPIPAWLESRLRAIARVAQSWLAPRSLWMRRATVEIPRHTPWSTAMTRACLTTTFSGYTVPSLREWLARDRPRAPRSLRSVQALIIQPSTVPAAAWQAATAAWLAGARVTLKPSRREPAFARLLAASVRRVAGSTLPIAVTRRMNASDVVIAYGCDETLQRIRVGRARRARRSAKRLIPFGTRFSIAIIGRHSLSKRNLSALVGRAAWDATLYDTQGCLSPQCFFIEEGATITPEKFADALAAEMRRLDRILPMRPIPGEAMKEESFRQRWQFLASQGRARIFGRHVVFHREAGFEPCGLRRVVFVVPFRRASEVGRHVGAWASRLSTIAVSDEAIEKKLSPAFARRSAIRWCEVGMMHEPPPWWRNGGISLLQTIHSCR